MGRLSELMSTKAPLTKTSLDLDISDVVGPTKKAEAPIKMEGPAKPVVPVLEQGPATPQETSPKAEEKTVPVPTHPTYGPLIPLRLPDGNDIMKPVVDCSGQEFISWAMTVLPLPGKVNSALYNTPEVRETTFNRIVHALGSQFLFGGSEYKKKKYSN